jgi:hypothetical protein
MKKILTSALAVFFALLKSHAQSSAFTYQGQLNVSGTPASGSYDLVFALYDSASGGQPLAGAQTNTALVSTNGVFTAWLDFGEGPFAGGSRWLEVGTRPHGTGSFTLLTPRQPITAAPLALFAKTAGSLSGYLSTTQLTGMLPTTQLAGTYPGVLTLSNPANGFTGSFTGSGSGLTNLQASAWVKIIAQTPPANGDTNWFGPWTPGTQTAGIQEAIMSLPRAADQQHPGGGTIWLMPGNYYTYTNIYVHNSGWTTPFTLNLRGAGITACGITYAGTAPQTVVTVGQANTPSNLAFSMHDMWIASAVNACTNILWFQGNALNWSALGGVAKVDLDHVWFGYWGSMTNANLNFGFSPSTFGDTAPHNLIPINFQMNFNEDTVVQHCHFTYVNGISWATDHGSLAENLFEFAGVGGAGPSNDWPPSSVYSLGAAVYCVEPGQTYNGNKGWTIRDNNFVSCSIPYYASPAFAGMVYLSQNDTFESPLSAPVVTEGTRWVFLNPRGYAGSQSLLLTNHSDYTKWAAAAIPAPTNLVVIVDLRAQTNSSDFAYGGTVRAKGFSGNAGGLTLTNAAGAKFQVLVNSATNGLIFVPQ